MSCGVRSTGGGKYEGEGSGRGMNRSMISWHLMHHEYSVLSISQGLLGKRI